MKKEDLLIIHKAIMHQELIAVALTGWLGIGIGIGFFNRYYGFAFLFFNGIIALLVSLFSLFKINFGAKNGK